MTIEVFIYFGLGFIFHVGSIIKGKIINANIQRREFKISKKIDTNAIRAIVLSLSSYRVLL